MNEVSSQVLGRFAQIALGHVRREYPHASTHVMTGFEDATRPAERHPIFHGSYDWHSCVHSHWLLARVLKLEPEMAEGRAIRAYFDQAFTSRKVAVETAYFRRPSSRGFERPYGWAWLLKLSAELMLLNGPWANILRPLAEEVAGRFSSYLPLAEYPVRAGVHSNTAFALAFALDWAIAVGEGELERRIEERARLWYGEDVNCQAWEPSGDDFLSPALMEAELMRRVMARSDFRDWFMRFLPEAGDGRPSTLFHPAAVSDRSDGKIAHLDGLNLSRAWCWRSIAEAFGAPHPVHARFLRAAQTHLDAALPHLDADYMGEHWLASFALLAVSEG